MLIGEHRRDRGLGYGDFYCVSNHPDMLGAADARFALEGDLRCLRPGPLRGGFDLFTGTGLSDLAFQVGSGGIAMPVRVVVDADRHGNATGADQWPVVCHPSVADEGEELESGTSHRRRKVLNDTARARRA